MPETVLQVILTARRIGGMTTRYSFDRQPGESEQAFTAFRAYLDLGLQRSLAAVGRQLGKSKAMMERWSSRWSWVARVEAYTDHMFRQVDLEQQRQVRGKIVRAMKALHKNYS